jgi:aldehyde:ferredoxin oxidoreductase
MGKGWQGKLLTVDVTTGKVGSKAPAAEEYRSYIGGVGLASRLLYDMIPAGADALGPQNVLAIFAGPVTGTRFPGAGRVEICARSPLTGGWGEASMGGFFGTQLRRAGWDGLLLQGAADSPHYLLIEDDHIRLVDAADIWMEDTYETERILRERHPGAEVACIGPGGATLALIAGVANRGGEFAGRCGLGAVLGSKKVKAVVAHGTGKVEVADSEAYNALVARHIEKLKQDGSASSMSEHGTAGGAEMVMMMGDMPVRNWSGEIWQEGAKAVSGPTMSASILTRAAGCFACTVRCKRIVQVGEGQWLVPEGPGPEYESVASLGTLLYHGDLAGVAKANELCNRMGLDTISTGSTIAWAMEAFARGALTKADTDGIELTWGNTGAILQAIEAIGYRRGKLGQLLAQGTRKAAQQLGKGSADYAIHVKGLELPMHNPRAFHGLALAYATLPHGASHNEGGFNQRGAEMPIEDWIDTTMQSIRLRTVANSGVFCNFTIMSSPMDLMAEALSLATGHKYTNEALSAFADSVYTLRYAFNLRMGQTPAANALPQRIVDQMVERDPFWATDWPLAMTAYYRVRGYDEQGYPTAEALSAAKLGFVVPHMKRWKR